MKKLGVVLLLLIVGFGAGCMGTSRGTASSSVPTGSVSSHTGGPHDYVDVNGTRIYLDEIHFYMYGMKTCPHCRHMHEWIPQEYGNGSLTYYELVNNDTNMKLFGEVAQLTGITGVPVIAITYNGTLYAIIEGEFNVTATPQIIAAAIRNDGMLLFVGRTYLLPYNSTKSRPVINALYTIFVRHESVDVQKILAELKSNSSG